MLKDMAAIVSLTLFLSSVIIWGAILSSQYNQVVVWP